MHIDVQRKIVLLPTIESGTDSMFIAVKYTVIFQRRIRAF
jgi:hypothetical protein